MLTAAETGLVQAIDDAAGAAMLARMLAWASINSGSDNLDGLARMSAALAEACAPLGEGGELVEGPPSEAVAADGGVGKVAHGRHYRHAIRPGLRPRVLLTGHMDTVYGAEHPFQTCRDIGDGRINGPGVADMKGGIVVLLAAVAAFERAPVAAALGIDIVVGSDEEVGSLSSGPVLAQAAAGARWGLTYEPSTTPEGAFAGARWGSGNFSAIVAGRAAHAGRNPGDGRNALLAAADLALRLEALIGVDLRVNPARIDGGGANNVVPAGAVLRFNVRPRSQAAREAAQAAIAAAIAAVSAARDVSITLRGGFGRPPKPLDATQAGLFAVVEAASGDLGLPFETRESGGVCDGNNLAALGLPVVDTLGVRGGAIHSAGEFMIVDSLIERARLSALLLHRLAVAHA